jgi:hypothetical protein
VTFEDEGSELSAVDDGIPGPAPEPDASGRRGEIHVLDATSSTSPVRASSSEPVQTLPFTGPHAAVLALLGLVFVAAGAALGRQLSQTF